MTRTTRARSLAAIVAVGSTLAVTNASADERAECVSAADQAQQLRDEGKYRGAREKLLVCARDACPALVKRDCLDWLTQLDNITPSVVFAAKEGSKDLADVKVYVDGALVTERLDGRPVPMDLGQHTIKFEHQGQTKEETVVIGAGQKSRNILVTFGPKPGAGAPGPAPAPSTSSEGSLVPAFIVGGVGVLAIGSFAIFGLSGKSDVSDMETRCKPNCTESEVDSARTKLIVADISLGVGVVALAVATYMILTRPKIDVEPGAVKTATLPSRPRPTHAIEGLRLDVTPTLGGGAVGAVGARF